MAVIISLIKGITQRINVIKLTPLFKDVLSALFLEWYKYRFTFIP